MDLEDTFNLISRNLEEVIDADNIKNILKTRSLKVYWGTAVTGKPHLGYYVPVKKIADLLSTGCEVTILFANLHGLLDGSSHELLSARTDIYQLIIKKMLSVIGAPIDKLKFILGTDFQLSSRYTLDVYKLTTMTTIEHVKHAGAEVVKQTLNPYMSSLIYPILQSLDEEYLGADVQLGGIDQRKIFMFAREWMPKIGYTKRSYLMNPLLPGLNESGKMSSSEPNSKIDFDDSDKVIRTKIYRSPIEKLTLMYKYICNESINWNSGAPIDDIKDAIVDSVISLVSPVRDMLSENLELLSRAYPAKVVNVGVTTQATIGSLNIVVGKIVSLLVDKPTIKIISVDIGDRTIPVNVEKFNNDMINSYTLVVTNVPKRVSCGYTIEGVIIDVYVPPGPIGERLLFNVDETPDHELTKKRLDRVLADIKSHDDTIMYIHHDISAEFRTSSGLCKPK